MSTRIDTSIPNMQGKLLNEHLKWMPVNSLVKMDESIFLRVDSRGKKIICNNHYLHVISNFLLVNHYIRFLDMI